MQMQLIVSIFIKIFKKVKVVISEYVKLSSYY